MHIYNSHIYMSLNRSIAGWVLAVRVWDVPRPVSIEFRTSADGVSHHGPAWFMGWLSELSLAGTATYKLVLLPEHSGDTHAADGCSLVTMESVELSLDQVQ